jgi:hypothetical protein
MAIYAWGYLKPKNVGTDMTATYVYTVIMTQAVMGTLLSTAAVWGYIMYDTIPYGTTKWHVYFGLIVIGNSAVSYFKSFFSDPDLDGVVLSLPAFDITVQGMYRFALQQQIVFLLVSLFGHLTDRKREKIKLLCFNKTPEVAYGDADASALTVTSQEAGSIDCTTAESCVERDREGCRQGGGVGKEGQAGGEAVVGATTETQSSSKIAGYVCASAASVLVLLSMTSSWRQVLAGHADDVYSSTISRQTNGCKSCVLRSSLYLPSKYYILA